MDKFAGTWERFELDNPEAMLTAFGASEEQGKMMRTAKEVITLEKKGDEWTETCQLGPKSNTHALVLGKEFESTIPTGEPHSVIFELEDGKIMGKLNFKARGVKMEVCRSVDGDVQTMKISSAGNTTTQKFKRI